MCYHYLALPGKKLSLKIESTALFSYGVVLQSNYKKGLFYTIDPSLNALCVVPVSIK